MKRVKNCACIGGVIACGAIFVVAGIVVLTAINGMAICFVALDDAV